MNDTYKSIGLFIDGGYYAKVNEALEEQLSLNININGIMNYIRQQVSQLSKSPLQIATSPKVTISVVAIE